MATIDFQFRFDEATDLHLLLTPGTDSFAFMAVDKTLDQMLGRIQQNVGRQLDEKMLPYFQAQAMNELIRERISEEMVERHHIVVTKEEIAKLLKQTPSLKLRVVGHTDGTGALDANMKLSQARGEAVVQALVGQYGIATSRLKGYGVGPLAPVASNATEEGRGKNRRVELVQE